MKTALMQPYFLPYIGAYQLVYAVDTYILYGYFNFRNDGWFHRNRLLEKDRGPKYFNVMMVDGRYYKRFYEIEVDPSFKWRKKLLKTIEQNYSKCDFFEENYSIFRSIILAEHKSLLDYNANSMISISRHLGITTDFVVAGSDYKDYESDLGLEFSRIKQQNDYSPELTVDKKTLRVINLCKRFSTDSYINPIGGQTLYDKTVFRANGIDLRFLKSRDIKYKQKIDEFIPNLSILDVLMNCGVNQTKTFLQEYDLI